MLNKNKIISNIVLFLFSFLLTIQYLFFSFSTFVYTLFLNLFFAFKSFQNFLKGFKVHLLSILFFLYLNGLLLVRFFYFLLLNPFKKFWKDLKYIYLVFYSFYLEIIDLVGILSFLNLTKIFNKINFIFIFMDIYLISRLVFFIKILAARLNKYRPIRLYLFKEIRYTVLFKKTLYWFNIFLSLGTTIKFFLFIFKFILNFLFFILFYFIKLLDFFSNFFGSRGFESYFFYFYELLIICKLKLLWRFIPFDFIFIAKKIDKIDRQSEEEEEEISWELDTSVFNTKDYDVYNSLNLDFRKIYNDYNVFNSFFQFYWSSFISILFVPVYFFLILVFRPIFLFFFSYSLTFYSLTLFLHIDWFFIYLFGSIKFIVLFLNLLLIFFIFSILVCIYYVYNSFFNFNTFKINFYLIKNVRGLFSYSISNKIFMFFFYLKILLIERFFMFFFNQIKKHKNLTLLAGLNTLFLFNLRKLTYGLWFLFSRFITLLNNDVRFTFQTIEYFRMLRGIFSSFNYPNEFFSRLFKQVYAVADQEVELPYYYSFMRQTFGFEENLLTPDFQRYGVLKYLNFYFTYFQYLKNSISINFIDNSFYVHSIYQRFFNFSDRILSLMLSELDYAFMNKIVFYFEFNNKFFFVAKKVYYKVWFLRLLDYSSLRTIFINWNYFKNSFLKWLFLFYWKLAISSVFFYQFLFNFLNLNFNKGFWGWLVFFESFFYSITFKYTFWELTGDKINDQRGKDSFQFNKHIVNFFILNKASSKLNWVVGFKNEEFFFLNTFASFFSWTRQFSLIVEDTTLFFGNLQFYLIKLWARINFFFFLFIIFTKILFLLIWKTSLFLVLTFGGVIKNLIIKIYAKF